MGGDKVGLGPMVDGLLNDAELLAIARYKLSRFIPQDFARQNVLEERGR